jgi:hypothetical protein
MDFKIMTNDNKQQKLSLRNKPLFFIARVICRFFGHKWKYNFPSIPNKAMCTRCKCKAVLDLKKLEWNNVDAFIGEKRTDKELARDWV